MVTPVLKRSINCAAWDDFASAELAPAGTAGVK
jgi:hypothetical protein